MTVVKPGDRVARVRAQLLHILYEIGREEHQFRLRYNGQFLRDAFFLEDYNLESNDVIHMVPLSKQKDVRFFNFIMACFRDFPQGFKVRVPGTPLCELQGSFNKI